MESIAKLGRLFETIDMTRNNKARGTTMKLHGDFNTKLTVQCTAMTLGNVGKP